MEKKKLLRAVIGLLILFLVPIPTNAFSPSIENGISWLTAKQNSDGSWGSNADLAMLDTSTVLDTFKSLNIGSPAYSNGVTWLSSQAPLSTDFISRKVISLSLAGVDVSADLSMLLTMRSLDGGWGGDADSEGMINDTALALQALKAANYLDQNIISSALGFLLATQNPDGGWGFYPAACPTCQADPSNVYMTAMVVSTLQQFAPTTSLVKAINKATDYLVAHQNADGGFGSSQSTIYETALAYIALVGVTTDVTILGKAATHLTSTQLADGSWLDDPYVTALAIKALYLAENKPQPPPPPDKGTATGKVIDSSTNALLKDVSVTLESNPGIKTATDQAGNFILANCPPGAQKLIFALPGYAGASASLTITVGTIVDLGSIPLAPNPTTGMVKGQVTEAATGMPLAGVLIDMAGAATVTTTTAADGTFSFIDVTPGQVTLTASKAGYYAITGSGNVLAGGTLFFNPQLPTTPPVAFTGSLIGRVYDAATDNPIQGASIALAGGPSTATGSNGAFAITEIAANTYEITIAAPGYMAQVYQVMIMAGVTIDMQTIYLSPSAQSTTITGKVTEAETGKAVAGATVTVPETGATAKTAAVGGYMISGIGLLEFTVTAAATGYNTSARAIKTSAYGMYAVDISLLPSQASEVRVISVVTDKQEYGVNSPVQVTTTLENSGLNATEAFVTADVIDEYGNVVAIILHSEDSVEIPAGGSSQAVLMWNTAQSPARGYTVTVQVFRSSDAMLLAEGYTIFMVRPEIQVDATNLVITPQFTHVKKAEPVIVAAWITNWSNIDASLSAEYEVRDPQNALIQSGSKAFSIPAFEFSRKIDIGQFEQIFSSSGAYPVKVNILSQGSVIATGDAMIHVAPAIRIEPSKSLKPDKVLPDGDKRIKIDIQIEGVEDKP
jgi:large repetitive protein